jgi:hypothetical protein
MIRRSLVIALALVAFAGCKKKNAEGTAGSASGGAVASGSAPGPAMKFAHDYRVNAANGMCSATEHGACPPDTECEPPAARAIQCPPGLADGAARVVELDDKSCVVAPDGCATQACLGAKTPCPLAKGETLPTLSWAVTALADGTCRASWTPAGAPSKTITIKCPIAETNLMITRKSADGPCTAEHGGKSIDVPCPVEPKQFTVAQLRDAITKDAAAFGKDRVRVTGVFVKSLMFSQPKGKNTLFTIGASDAKGDAKNAVRCNSILEFTEIADGDPVIVEGLPKKAGNDLVLDECQSSVP